MSISGKLYDDHLELLYIEGEHEGELKQHYVYIKDFNRFMFNFTKHKERKNFCMHCLQCFYSNISLAKHKKDCVNINGDQAIELPKTYVDKNGQGRTPSVYFHNHQKQLPVPFGIHADFESINEKISSCRPSDQQSCTEKHQKHTVTIGFSCKRCNF